MTSMTDVLRKRIMGNEFRQRGGNVKIQGEHCVHEDSCLWLGREACTHPSLTALGKNQPCSHVGLGL